jgi:hypothetical protein
MFKHYEKYDEPPSYFLKNEAVSEKLYKIGFHTGPGGNRNGIGDYWKALDAAGIPAVLISVDDAGPCYELDLIAKASGVPHVNIYRVHVNIPGFDASVPDYSLDPYSAAKVWWETVYPYLPPELMDGFTSGRIWLIAGNELDKNRASWLGYWAHGVATRANSVGVSIAAFGWSSGEPEYDDWTTPGMAEYLRYCERHPNQAALALHEYSYTLDLQDGIGYLIGRFEFIHDACYELGIDPLKILKFITEFGWTYTDIPSPGVAMDQMENIAILYNAHPDVKGAMVWYLGGGFSNIANQAQKLIVPVTERSLAWGYSPPDPDPDPDPPPGGGTMTDLAEYFVPEAGLSHGPIYMVENNWGQGPERVHLSVSPKGSARHFYVAKNGRWERRYIGEDWIWLQADTSRADNEFYTVHGDPWIPRHMSVGQRYTRDETTRIYSLDSCDQIDGGRMISDIEFLGHHTEKAAELSAKWGVEVIELHWYVNATMEEKYFYGRWAGLMAWQNRWGKYSEISEFVPTSEQPNHIGWHCSVLDEFPPTNAGVNQYLWDVSLEVQTISLNPLAALQKAIYGINYVPVGSETRASYSGIDYALQPCEALDGRPRLVAVAVVPHWNNVSFISDPG